MGRPDAEKGEPGGEELDVLARRFADEARGALVSALERSMERFVVARADRFNVLGPEAGESFHRAVDQAIRQGAREAAESLTDPDLWRSPSVEVGKGPQASLDHPANRVWIRLTKAASHLDPVLREFGFEPSAAPDPGGGHYGLQPRSLGELDSRGTLGRLWDDYCRRYRRLAERRRAEAEGRALRRWRTSR